MPYSIATSILYFKCKVSLTVKGALHYTVNRGDGLPVKNRIKELRKMQRISQEKMAIKLDVSRQTIISIEKGKYNPSLPLAMQIARLFNRTVEEVFILDDEDIE